MSSSSIVRTERRVSIEPDGDMAAGGTQREALVSMGQARPDEDHNLARTESRTAHGLEDMPTQSCFKNETWLPAEPCNIERGSQEMVWKWIRPSDVVLEVGARYGTVSCMIASKQQQSGKVLSAEPDSKVWQVLDSNLQDHHCAVKVFKGVVGNKSVTVTAAGTGGYGTFTSIQDPAQEAPAQTFAALEASQGLSFNAAMIDCEGCLPTLLAQNPGMLDRMEVMLIEAHNDAEKAAIEQIAAHGLTIREQSTDTAGNRQYALTRASSGK